MIVPFADTHVELLAGGLIWFPAYKLLCASDIHLEKGSFFQRFATLLPPYDTRATLEKLAEATARFKPDTFLSLGDGFHDMRALQRMHAEDQQRLHALIAAVGEWIWIMGNHDPVIPEILGGIRCDTYHAYGIAFRHQAEPRYIDWEISGHYHPVTRISLRGHTMRLPCFVKSQKRLLLPAFGRYTGGLDVTNPSITMIAPAGQREFYLLHGAQVIKWKEAA